MNFPLRATAVGTLVFAATLALNAPASLVASLAAPTITLDGVQGSLWVGSARSGHFGKVALGSLSWRWRPQDLFTARLGFAVQLSAPGPIGQGKLSVGPLGFQASDLNVSADAEVLQPLVAEIGEPRGLLSLALNRLRLSSGRLHSAEGLAEWKNARLRYSKTLRLGDVKAEIKDEGDRSVALLSNAGGDFGLSGQLALDRAGAYQVHLSYKTTRRTPQDVREALNLLGKPDPQGDIVIDRSGQLGR